MSLKKNILVPASLFVMLAGCTEKELESPSGIYPDYLATETGEISIKAPEGSAFGATDNLAVFSSRDVSTNMMFPYSSGSFTGEGVISDTYCMLYPYQAGATASLDGNQFIISAEVASEQSGYGGIFISAGAEMAMNQACATARIPFVNSRGDIDITKVSITPMGSEALSGTTRFMVSPGVKPMSIGSSGSAGAGVSKQVAMTVHESGDYVDLFVAPQALSSGYKVSVTQADGVISEVEFRDPVSFKAGDMTELPVFEFAMPEFYIEYTAPSEIKVDGYLSEYADGTGRIYFSTSVVPANLLLENASITGLRIPANITEIGKYAFDNCTALASLEFEDNSTLTAIRDTAFRNCAMTVVDFPASLEVLGKHSFNNCTKLVTVNFPADSRLRRAEQGALNGCAALKDVVMPASLEYMDKIFNTKFTTPLVVHFLGTKPPELASNANNTFNVNSLDTIYVPAGCAEEYKTAWGARYQNANQFAKVSAAIKEEP
ncbi:MAG: leucine-rich repeat domain-containing protein [Bacteroidetes bacterium]|uniref:Leucine-rich repeat domain-containing protein n=1 Tax=Candidatus Cryptobacteroides merdigallinarum TaxID=2840770 RepID=A0A9D9HFX0_9BACT|nr:leucine-rich repeat domain-containing protein [Candidatus Cryptobacteroides merdigallinarum]